MNPGNVKGIQNFVLYLLIKKNLNVRVNIVSDKHSTFVNYTQQHVCICLKGTESISTSLKEVKSQGLEEYIFA
jgi:hypothetical protein